MNIWNNLKIIATSQSILVAFGLLASAGWASSTDQTQSAGSGETSGHGLKAQTPQLDKSQPPAHGKTSGQSSGSLAGAAASPVAQTKNGHNLSQQSGNSKTPLARGAANGGAHANANASGSEAASTTGGSDRESSNPTRVSREPANDPKSVARTLLKRGLAQSAKGNGETAETLFKAAIYMDPNNADARYNLGVLAEGRGDMAEALANYQMALRMSPNDNDLKDAVHSVQSRMNSSALIDETSSPSAHSPSNRHALTEPASSPYSAPSIGQSKGEAAAPFSNISSGQTFAPGPLGNATTSNGMPQGYTPQPSMGAGNSSNNSSQSRMARHALKTLVRMGFYMARF